MTAPVDGAGRHRVGLDIGGTKIHAVVLDPHRRVLAQERMPSGWGPSEVLTNAAAATRHALSEAELSLTDIDLVGIGIPGAVNHRTGEVAQAVNLGLDRVPLAMLLAEELSAQVGVHVENDVNAAALGVALTRAGRVDAAGRRTGTGEPESLAYLNLGTGMAAGIVVDGRLWRGVSGAAGEIGHIPVDSRGPRCSCGQRGCLETMASGSGIEAQWRRERGDAPFSAPELPELAGRDRLAAKILANLHTSLAAAVRLLVLTTDVQRVVVGGGVTGLGDFLFPRVRAILLEWEGASAFLASLAPSDRMEILDGDAPVAAIGAALAGELPREVSTR